MNSLLTPGEMIELFVRRLLHLLFDVGVPRDGRVSFIKRLRSDLTRMIHTHQAGRMRSLRGIELGAGYRRSGIGARRMTRRRCDCP